MILMGEEHISGKRALKGCLKNVYKAENYDSERKRHSDVYRQLREVKVSKLKGID